MIRRTRDQIITGILSTCLGGGANKTKIVYACNMNFEKAGEYLSQLAETGLLEVIEGDPVLYRTTLRGELALESLGTLKELIPMLFSGD